MWDFQCYNVNTGDADDLLCENLDWGIHVIKGTGSLTVSSNQRPKEKKNEGIFRSYSKSNRIKVLLALTT